MMLHMVRSRPHTLLLLRTYRLDARLEVAPDERAVIRAHKLHKFEIFADPYRDHLLARADAARDHQKALPWFITRDEDRAALYRELGRELAALVGARLCFRITIGNLISGISITNRRLTDIAKVEHVLHKSVDAIAATVAAALRYQDHYEDIHAPGDEEDQPRDATPGEWSSSW